MVRGLGWEPRQRTLVYGTMFAVRASILMPVWKRYSATDFVRVDETNPHAGYGLAGDWEIMSGLLVRAQGYDVSSGVLPEWLARIWYSCKGCAFRVVRFLSDGFRQSPLAGAARRICRRKGA